ncbi:MAG: hypothetical protein HYV28_09275 [Ignavibacteriales bacterium]|nr:hypothetical protein [Ignavibacteriales bacterium]
MKNRTKVFVTVLSILFQAILFTGCGTILYTSTNPPVNLTEKSGEVYVQAAGGSNGFNAAAGFSPGEHFQVAAAYSNNTVDEENENTKRVSQEFMVGYFNKFESGFVLETFLGVGTGSTKTTVLALPLFSDIKDTTRHTGECNKLFLELNYGIKSSWREVGLSIRCSQLNYSNVEKTGNGGFVLYKGAPKAVLWEPVVFTKIGNEYIKLTLMVGMPYIPGVQEISYEQFFISAGVGLNFSL